MNDTVMNTASCVASVVNGPNGKLVVICSTVIMLYVFSGLRTLIEGGHAITVQNENIGLKVA